VPSGWSFNLFLMLQGLKDLLDRFDFFIWLQLLFLFQRLILKVRGVAFRRENSFCLLHYLFSLKAFARLGSSILPIFRKRHLLMNKCLVVFWGQTFCICRWTRWWCHSIVFIDVLGLIFKRLLELAGIVSWIIIHSLWSHHWFWVEILFIQRFQRWLFVQVVLLHQSLIQCLYFTHLVIGLRCLIWVWRLRSKVWLSFLTV